MTNPTPPARTDAENAAPIPWRCFHCDEVFTDAESARLHFGATERQQPACTIDIVEYRAMEEVNRRHCEEDTELHRQIHRLMNECRQAMRREEEIGYARGLADTNASRAFLAELVAAKWGVSSVAALSESSMLGPGMDPRLHDAYNRALAHLRGMPVSAPPGKES